MNIMWSSAAGRVLIRFPAASEKKCLQLISSLAEEL
jgi:hypothetical protein